MANASRSPLESSVVVPGVPLMAADLHESRKPVISLVVSIFVLGFGFGPILLSPLSEVYGRRLLYNVCNVVTLGFSIGSALAPSIAPFIVFRFIAGCFGAGPMNIGGGSIADQVAMEKRGAVMSLLFTGIFLGPVIGLVACLKLLGRLLTLVWLGLLSADLLQKMPAGDGCFGFWRSW